MPRTLSRSCRCGLRRVRGPTPATTSVNSVPPHAPDRGVQKAGGQVCEGVSTVVVVLTVVVLPVFPGQRQCVRPGGRRAGDRVFEGRAGPDDRLCPVPAVPIA